MADKYSPTLFMQDLRFGMEKARESWAFILKHRLWEGFWKFGWVMRLLVFAGLVAGGKLFAILREWYAEAHTENIFAFTQSLGSLAGEMVDKGYHFFFLGGFKYVVLLLVEIIVFHFVRRTLEIKTGIAQDFTPKTFLAAQIRMFKIVLRNYGLETVCTIVVTTVLSILGLEWGKNAIILVIQAYFLGFAVVDNYNETFGMKINQSARTSRHYPGLVIAVGLVTYVLLLLPLVGAIFAPFFVAVMATLAFHDLRTTEGQWRYDWETAKAK